MLFLKAIILKAFNEVVLNFSPVEAETNILYVNINFTGNLFFGFGRYCGKVVQKPADSHSFWATAFTKNVLSIFFSRWHLVNDSRNKRVSSLLLCFIGFETINFDIFFIKMSCFGSKLFFWKQRATNNYQKHGHPFYSSLSWISVQNFKANREVVLVLAFGEHDDLWFSLTLLPVHY